jgi:RNA polymerase sigma-70 factor, ECF subfamily
VAIREFLQDTYPRLVAGVALVAGSHTAAEDAVQEALARAWECSLRGERIESLAAWVTRVAINVSKSRLRRLRGEAKHRRLMAPEAERSSSGVAAADVRIDVKRALAELPRRQREVTVLRYYLGLDVAEVAGILEITEGTVKTSLHRARRSLAATLGNPESEEASHHARI